MVNKLSTENAEIYLGWTENILDTMPFGKKDNFTIITWLTLGVTWGALKRFSHRFQIISPVSCGWKTFDTLLELKRRIRIFSCVVWNGSCQTRTPHERHESSEQTTTDEHHIFPCSIDDKNTIRETKHQLTCSYTNHFYWHTGAEIGKILRIHSRLPTFSVPYSITFLNSLKCILQKNLLRHNKDNDSGSERKRIYRGPKSFGAKTFLA